MKATLVAILFASCAFAQVQTPPVPQAACGPKNVQFETQTAKGAALPQPEAGKGLVYVVEVFEKVVGELGRPTLRVGVDGKWAGADKDNSYMYFSVDPGEHNLCTNWQSHWKRLSSEAAFTSFTAEPDKTYYFRARITEFAGPGGAANFSLNLEPVTPIEGQYLVAQSSSSVARPKP